MSISGMLFYPSPGYVYARDLGEGTSVLVPEGNGRFMRGRVVKNSGYEIDFEMTGGHLRQGCSPYTEVKVFDPQREILWNSTPEEFTMPVLEWQKKKGADIHRAVVEERTYLIEKSGKKFACRVADSEIATGTLEQCKTKAQQHLNKTPPPKVTTVMAIAIAKRSARLGKTVREFCGDKKLLNELILDGLGVTESVIRQAERWRAERPMAALSGPVNAPAPVKQPRPRQMSDSAPAARIGAGKGKRGYQILGHSSLGVIHWCAANGFSVEQTKKVLAVHGITTITDENLSYRWKAGKKPERCKPAPLTAEQQAQLKREGGVK